MKRSATPELLDTDSGTSAEVATALARVRRNAAPLLLSSEMQVHQLKLTKHSCADSAELLTWCDRNTNRCHITRVAAETSGKSRWIQASAGESVRPANYTLRKDETVSQKTRSWGRFYFPRKEAAPGSAAQSETKRRSE